MTDAPEQVPAPVAESPIPVRTIDDTLEIILALLGDRRNESARSAEMFEGLRRQVISARTARTAHLVDLVQVASALDHGAERDDLQLLLRDLLDRAGVLTLQECDDDMAQHFESSGPEEDDTEQQVVDPAYVEADTGRTIRMGRLGTEHRRGR